MVRIIRIGIVLLNIIYLPFKLLPTKYKVTMISRQSNDPSIEFEMIKKELKAKDSGIQVEFLCRTLDGGYESRLSNKISYCFHMLVQMYHIATSKVVMLDSYCIAISILNHKKSLKVIQMWHSMGTMKKFGYTALDTEEGTKKELAYAMKMHHNYDYVFASSDAYKDHLAKGFNCDIDKIITMPLPRLDLLKSKKYASQVRRDIYQKYPKLKEKKTILYCPTFRKDETDFEKALDRLIEAVGEEFNLVVKLHPLSKIEMKGTTVLEAGEFSSFEMLFAADYVISDYSCIVYEAAVLGIPLYFYNFDMELYENGRGLAIDYEKELPGAISGDARIIIDSIANEGYNRRALGKFADKYIFAAENVTESIVNFILEILKR